MKKLFLFITAYFLFCSGTPSAFAAPEGTSNALKWADKKVAHIIDELRSLEADATAYEKIKADQNQIPEGQDSWKSGLCIIGPEWSFFFGERLNIGSSNLEESWDLLKPGSRNGCLTHDVDAFEYRIAHIIGVMERANLRCRQWKNEEDIKQLFREAKVRINQIEILRDQLLINNNVKNGIPLAGEKLIEAMKQAANGKTFVYGKSTPEQAKAQEEKDFELLHTINLADISYQQQAQCSQDLSRFYSFHQLRAQWEQLQNRWKSLSQNMKELSDFGKEKTQNGEKTKTFQEIIQEKRDDIQNKQGKKEREQEKTSAKNRMKGWISRNIADVVKSFDVQLTGGISYIDKSTTSQGKDKNMLESEAQKKALNATKIPQFSAVEPKTDVLHAYDKVQQEYDQILVCERKDYTLKLNTQHIDQEILETMETDVDALMSIIIKENNHLKQINRVAQEQCDLTSTCP